MAHPSPRQLELLQLTAQGLTLVESAQRLYITENSAKSHMKRAFVALGARNQAHAVALAIGAGLIEAPSATADMLAAS